MKVNFAHRERNTFKGDRASEKGLISRKHQVSSVTSEIIRSYRVLRVARDYRARFAIFNLQCQVYGNLWKYASVMLVQVLYFQCIYIGLYIRENIKSFDSL